VRIRVVRLFERGVPIPDRERPEACAGELRSAMTMDNVRKRMGYKVTLVGTDKGGRPTDVLPVLSRNAADSLTGGVMVETQHPTEPHSSLHWPIGRD
jgi:hypothetical protein